MYHERYDQGRPLLGIDLSPRMVSIASKKSGSNGQVVVGDMRDLSTVKPILPLLSLIFLPFITLIPRGCGQQSMSGNVCCDQAGSCSSLHGRGLALSTMETIKVIVALRYLSDELSTRTQKTGFNIFAMCIEPVEDSPWMPYTLKGRKRSDPTKGWRQTPRKLRFFGNSELWGRAKLKC